jgi:hypothetical protein
MKPFKIPKFRVSMDALHIYLEGNSKSDILEEANAHAADSAVLAVEEFAKRFFDKFGIHSAEPIRDELIREIKGESK